MMIDVMTHWSRLGHIRHKVQGHPKRDKKRRKSTDVASYGLDRYSYAFFCVTRGSMMEEEEQAVRKINRDRVYNQQRKQFIFSSLYIS